MPSSGMVEANINNRWKIMLPKFRADRPEWPWWEKERLASMYETTKPGDVVYYVGAESGDMAGLLAMWGAKLVLFEPNDKAWPQIKAVWEANKLDMTDIFFPGFASDKTTSTDFTEIKDIQGKVIHDHGFKELLDPGNIPQVKIDDLPWPTMISIDVEGAEGRVLRGAEQTLRQYHPRIYLSLHHDFMYRNYNENWYDLVKWLEGLGYTRTVLGNQSHEGHDLYEAS